MVRRLFICLAVMILGSHATFGKEEEANTKKDVEAAASKNSVAQDQTESNRVLMYRMINYQTNEPIKEYHRWRKERHLEWFKLRWLFNHKNLTVPGRMGDKAYGIVPVPGKIDDEPY